MICGSICINHWHWNTYLNYNVLFEIEQEYKAMPTPAVPKYEIYPGSKIYIK